MVKNKQGMGGGVVTKFPNKVKTDVQNKMRGRDFHRIPTKLMEVKTK